MSSIPPPSFPVYKKQAQYNTLDVSHESMPGKVTLPAAELSLSNGSTPFILQLGLLFSLVSVKMLISWFGKTPRAM